MREIGIWESQSPEDEALRSLAPFCHDTLLFQQWLQWVMLPQMRHVVEGRQTCPTSSEILPLAEYRLLDFGQSATPLLTAIDKFDHLINRYGRQLGGAP